MCECESTQLTQAATGGAIKYAVATFTFFLNNTFLTLFKKI